MNRSPATPVRLRRCVATWAGSTALTLLALGALRPELAGGARIAGHLAAQPLEAGLRTLATLALAMALGWWWTVSTLVVAQALRGTAPRRPAGCPRLLHRLLLAGLGTAVLAGLAGPADADPPTVPAARPAASPAHALRGLPLPDRVEVSPSGVVPPVRPTTPAPGPGPRVSPEPGRWAIVRPGDSLWALAARDLPGASTAEVAARCRELYRLNRAVIGPDPDLIVAGTRLLMAGPPPREEHR